MSPPVRAAIGILGGAALAVLLITGGLGLPSFGAYRGPYGDLLNAVTPEERHILNVVTGINFDYRGLDTLGEEYILFAAVAAAALLLRTLRSEDEDAEQEDHASDASAEKKQSPNEVLHVWGRGVIGATLLFGVYMVYHAVTSPGGGFQGGSVLASAWLVVYLAGDMRLLHRVTSHSIVQLTEAVGAAIYAGTGIGMLLLGGAFLQNMLPLGTLGSPLAGGMIPVINAGVGLEVTAGFVLILLEFLRQIDEVRSAR